MSTYTLDSFTDSAYTLLTDHVGEIHASWNPSLTGEVPNAMLVSPSNRVFRCDWNPTYGSDCVNGSQHYVTYTYPSDYVVEADFVFLGLYNPGLDPGGGGSEFIRLPYRASDGASGIATFSLDDPEVYNANRDFPGSSGSYDHGTRSNSGTNNNPSAGDFSSMEIQGRVVDPATHEYYALGYSNENGYWYLSAGLEAPYNHSTNKLILAQWYSPMEVGISYNLKLVMVGSSIQGWVDGIKRFNVTDTSHASGIVGLRADGGSSSVRGIHADNFKVHNEFPVEADAWTANLTATGYCGGVVDLSWQS